MNDDVANAQSSGLDANPDGTWWTYHLFRDAKNDSLRAFSDVTVPGGTLNSQLTKRCGQRFESARRLSFAHG